MGFGFFNQLDTKQFPLEISDLRTKLSCLQVQATYTDANFKDEAEW